MDIADHAVGIDDPFPIQAQDHPQHPVGARMLRSQVEDELVRVEGLTDSPWGFERHVRLSVVTWLLNLRFIRKIPQAQPILWVLH